MPRDALITGRSLFISFIFTVGYALFSDIVSDLTPLGLPLIQRIVLFFGIILTLNAFFRYYQDVAQ